MVEAKSDTRRHLGAQAWREVFRRFDGSGDSVVGFCRREGLNTSSFRRWRKRLETTATTSTAQMQAQEAREPTRQPPVASFIEMGSMGAASAAAARLEVRLELGGGVVLQLVRG